MPFGLLANGVAMGVPSWLASVDSGSNAAWSGIPLAKAVNGKACANFPFPLFPFGRVENKYLSGT